MGESQENGEEEEADHEDKEVEASVAEAFNLISHHIDLQIFVLTIEVHILVLQNRLSSSTQLKHLLARTSVSVLPLFNQHLTPTCILLSKSKIIHS